MSDGEVKFKFLNVIKSRVTSRLVIRSFLDKE